MFIAGCSEHSSERVVYAKSMQIPHLHECGQFFWFYYAGQDCNNVMIDSHTA